VDWGVQARTLTPAQRGLDEPEEAPALPVRRRSMPDKEREAA
jgi:hypothetical protein